MSNDNIGVAAVLVVFMVYSDTAAECPTFVMMEDDANAPAVLSFAEFNDVAGLMVRRQSCGACHGTDRVPQIGVFARGVQCCVTSA